MRRFPWMTLCAAALLVGGACLNKTASSEERLADIHDVDSHILIDIRYSTDKNFTHTVLYPINRCLLRLSVAKRLSLVQSDLARQGLSIKVWDCYRPLSIQRKLWSIVPNPNYVADPKQGSRHNRGAAVDVTLVDSSGAELEMPTGYDDFSPKAHRDFMDVSATALLNRKTLETAMQKHGFFGLPTEWWHFDASGWQRYPLMDIPLTDGASNTTSGRH